MAVHYCSSCGAFRYHEASFQPGGWHCPCGQVDRRQNPHPPMVVTSTLADRGGDDLDLDESS